MTGRAAHAAGEGDEQKPCVSPLIHRMHLQLDITGI